MKVDYRRHVRKTRETFNKKIAEIRDDPRLPDRAWSQMLDEISREYRTAMNTARREAEEALNAELDRLDRQANPAPIRGQRTAAQIAERRELRGDLERRWQRDQTAVLEGYREAVRLGDALAMEVIEQYGPEFVKDHALRREFVDLTVPQKVARMTPQQVAAAEAHEALKDEESVLMLGIGHQMSLAKTEAERATSGRPHLTRDEAIATMASRGEDTGGR